MTHDPSDGQPSGGTLRPTSGAALTLWAAAGLVGGWLLRPVAEQSASPVPVPPVTPRTRSTAPSGPSGTTTSHGPVTGKGRVTTPRSAERIEVLLRPGTAT